MARRILGAATVVGGLSVAVKLVSAVKEVAVAYQYGVGDALDAFLVAFILPSFAVNVVGGSAPAALVPVYVEVQEEKGPGAARDLLGSLTTLFLICFVGVILLLAAVGSEILPILGSNFGPSKLALTERLFYLLLPVIAVGGLATLWSAVLNAHDRFALAATAPAGPPLLAGAAVLIWGESWGIYALAAGTLAGFALQLTIIAISLHGQDLTPSINVPRLRGRTIEVLRQYAPMVIGALLMSGTMVVDKSMAGMLPPGSVSSLSYGHKIAAVAAGLGSTAIGTAALPHFSRLVAQDSYAQLRETLSTYGRWILVLLVPITVALVWLSEPLVHLFFERGAFTASDTVIVTRVQQFYLLQIPFYVLGILFVRFISSVKMNHILMWGAVITLGLDVLLNYLFMQQFGVSGIALSTAACYFASCLFLGTMTVRALRVTSGG